MNVRILHVLGDSKFGGASFGILRLARFWKSVGWEVEILATDPVFLEAARKENVRTVQLNVIWRSIRPWKDLRGLIRLWCYLRTNSYTVVHTHTTKAGFVGRIAARLAGVPIVLHTAHGFAFHEKSPRLKVLFYTLMERVASWACDRVITVSHFHADWGRRLGIAAAEKIRAIPNGIPDPPRSSSTDCLSLRNAMGVQPGQVVLFTPGRLAAEKGLEDLIDAVELLRERSHRPFVLWIAGEGPLHAELESRVAARELSAHVRFLGFRNDVAALLDSCDIVVLPTWREGLSIALLESLAAGKPIVTTDISPNIEATQAGRGACLVAPGRPEELARAIANLASDSEAQAEKAVGARQVFLDNYTHWKMLTGYHHLYIEMLRGLDASIGENNLVVDDDSKPGNVDTGDLAPASTMQPIQNNKEIDSAEPVSCLQPASDR